jgi:hypothetical protein
VTNTRCCIDKIDSPDDEHEVAGNMLRIEINKYKKELCVTLVIYKNYTEMAARSTEHKIRQLRYLKKNTSRRKPEIAQMDEAATILDIGVKEDRVRHGTMQRKGRTDKYWFGAGNLAFLTRRQAGKKNAELFDLYRIQRFITVFITECLRTVFETNC